MKKRRKSSRALPRTHRIAVMLNEEEYKTIYHYLAKYKITNKSRWFREVVMTSVIQRLSDDYPTLFSENEMRG